MFCSSLHTPDSTIYASLHSDISFTRTYYIRRRLVECFLNKDNNHCTGKEYSLKYETRQTEIQENMHVTIILDNCGTFSCVCCNTAHAQPTLCQMGNIHETMDFIKGMFCRNRRKRCIRCYFLEITIIYILFWM